MHGGPPNLVQCVPVPDWVDHAPYASQKPDSSDDYTLNGVCQLLFDNQICLTGGEPAWHSRTARRILTRAGAEQVAHFAVEFDPGYERLDVHHVRLLRGDEIIEHAKPDAIQTFRRETSLERMILNGRLTATLLIPDVRVDDVVECSFTVRGGHPVLGGKLTTWTVFDCFNPWLETRHRLIRPNARNIVTKAFNDPPSCEVVERDGSKDSRWRYAGQRRRDGEDCTPPWLLLAPALHHTEFSSWNEVAKLFVSHYQHAEIPDGLVEEIDRLAALHPAPAEFAVEWLRFVQRGLRYFALSLGEGGLIPRSVEAIWASRFGDCKDAAQLYVAGARRNGLDACAALVSTTLGPSLDGFLPSPAVFNHCIVRLRLSGATYWLDPTCPPQGGTLDNVFQPHTGWALPLTVEADRLEDLGGRSTVHFLHCDDDLHLGPRRDSPAKFRRQIDYFSASADATRNRIANDGSGEYAKQALKELQAIWPDATEVAPMEVHDDQVKNRFTTILTYETRDCWKDESGALSLDIVDTTLPGELMPLNMTTRQADIFLGRPRKVTRRARIHMPCRWGGMGWNYESGAPDIRYTDRLDFSGRTIENAKEFEIGAWSLPPKNADLYREVVDKLRINVLKIPAQTRFGKVRPVTGAGWGMNFGTAWIIFIALSLLVSFVKVAFQPAQKPVEPTKSNTGRVWQPPAGTVWPSPNSGTVIPR
jgi:transglutaminase-like putative cysteine protease